MDVGVGVDVDAVVGGPDDLPDLGVEVSARVPPVQAFAGGLVGVDVEEWSPFVEGGGVDGGDGEAGYVGHGCSFSKVGWREGRLGVAERVSRNHQVGWFCSDCNRCIRGRDVRVTWGTRFKHPTAE